MKILQKIKGVLPNFALLVFSVLLGLTVCESYLRYVYQKNHESLVAKYKKVETVNLSRELCAKSAENPDLIYTYIPHKCGANSHGYFDNEYSDRKAEGTFRIIVIGDSVAQGLGLKPGASFGKVLEKQLNGASKNGEKFEVIVLARSGYSTSQELIVLQDEALKYEPDLIIWSYVLNDPAHPIYQNANGELGSYFFKPKIHVLHLISKGLFAIDEAWKSLACETEYHQRLHCVHWDDVKSNIEKIGDISQSQKIPVLFLIHPIFEEHKNFSQYSLAPLHDKLTQLAVKDGLIPIDLLAAYKHYNPDDLKQNAEDPWHPNEKGHKIIADFIYQKLVKTRSLLMPSK
jgi:lysophospholipase L1-like esterase